MTLYPVIIDSRPDYLTFGAEPASLLLTPVGTACLGSELICRLSAVSGERPAVLTTFPFDESYRQALRSRGLDTDAVYHVSDFEALASRYEPSDVLVMIDAGFLPSDAVDLEGFLAAVSGAGRAEHWVGMTHYLSGAREYAVLEPDGNLSRIQRYFDGVTWSRVSGVFVSCVPAACVQHLDVEGFESLLEFRKALISANVPSHDTELGCDVLDLTSERGLLDFSERMVARDARRPNTHFGNGRGAGVLVGRGCEIDGSARVIGPVVIHDGAVLERDAMVIGPAVLGQGCRVGRNSVVAQCVVEPGATVAPDTAVRHRVWLRSLQAERATLEADEDIRVHVSRRRFAMDAPAGSPRAKRSAYASIKRVVDAAVAGVSLVLLSPVLALSALLIKAASRGPVLFSHRREGLGGREFHCLKFRTMVADAHRQQRSLYSRNRVDGPQFKLDRDPRITWVGKRLREGNIDELPQLINVVRGDMSLIGPRPSPFRENQICVPWREARLSVRPGITGLWQVCRHDRSLGDFHQWIYYDMLYVRHMSPWLDAKILAATVLTMGGRWSVPISWLISKKKLREDAGSVDVEGVGSQHGAADPLPAPAVITATSTT